MSLESLAYALLAGLLPSFVWLFFWTKEDKEHPEPRYLIAATFLGGAVSVAVAVIIEQYVAGIWTDPSVRYSFWAATEEIVKFAAVGVIALSSDWNDEPIDAMIYCITAALGFAALENILFIMGPLSSGDLAKSLITGNMRFLGATLVHVVSSASIGFALGWAFYKSRAMKILATTIGLGAAVALHAAFNIAIIDGNAMDTLRAFGWVWGAVVVLILLFEEVKAVRPRFA